MRKKSQARRRSFLIDSNLKERKKPKRVRNNILNSLSKLWSVKIWKWQNLWPNLLRLVLLAMAIFIGFSAFSPYFKLKSVVVKRQDPLINIQEIQDQLKDFYGRNTLFLPQEDIYETLSTAFPEFQSIEVLNVWPDEISIEIEMAPSAYTVLNEEDATFHVITSKGITLGKKDGNDLPVLKLLQYIKPIQPRSELIEPEYLEFIQKGKTYLESEMKLEVKGIEYLYAAQEIHFIVTTDTSLWFSLRIPLEDQLRRLSLGADRATLYTNPPVHVDLRIPSQFYWLPR